MTKQIWVDVSHVLHWAGRLTGIERVEYNLIKHYYLHTNAMFIQWNHTRKRFVDVSRADVNRLILERQSKTEIEKESSATRQRGRYVELVFRVARTRATKNLSGGVIIVASGLWDKPNYAAKLKELAATNELVHVVHDAIPITHPAFVVKLLPQIFEDYMLNVLPVCALIVTNSESTSRDIDQVLSSRKLHKPPIASFRLGDEITRSTKSKEPTGVSRGNFILSVGTIEARKNHMLLYYAYKDMLSKGLKLPNLYIVGRRGWHTKDFQYLVENDVDVSGSIKILDTITDNEISWLYKNCLFTVVPSFYEGFGLPVAESLNYGKVTLSSNTSSLPEAGGAFADYFSPYSASELGNLVQKYLKVLNRKSREEQIRRNHKAVSWAESSKMFDDVVRKHLG